MGRCSLTGPGISVLPKPGDRQGFVAEVASPVPCHFTCELTVCRTLALCSATGLCWSSYMYLDDDAELLFEAISLNIHTFISKRPEDGTWDKTRTLAL